jgi:colicin import membrane protein
MEAYTSRLVAALRQNHQKPLGLSDLLSADVECVIGADGTISNVHVDRSSGNAAFDQSCIEAFMRMGTIGPTPDGKSGTWNIKFHMVDPD